MQPLSRSDSAPPPWLRWFVNDVTRGIIDRQDLPPLGCHFFRDVVEDCWEVTLFVSRTEVLGGPRDGERLPNHLQVDLSVAMAAFDEMPRMYWQVGRIAEDDDLGSHLALEGRARGRQVWLRIIQEAPEDVGPGRLLHAADGVLEDLW